MADRGEHVVSHALQAIADIDQNLGGRVGGHRDVGAGRGLVFDLEAANGVLKKERHGAKIGVGGYAGFGAGSDVADVLRLFRLLYVLFSEGGKG